MVKVNLQFLYAKNKKKQFKSSNLSGKHLYVSDNLYNTIKLETITLTDQGESKKENLKKI